MATSKPSEEGDAINVKEFLTSNKLADVLDIFVKREITIEELIEFDKDDLNEFGQSIGLDLLQRKRFVKAVLKLQPQGVSAPQSAMTTTGQYISTSKSPQHVIVSPEEHEAISSLNVRYNETGKLIKDLEGSFAKLEESSKQCKVSVNDGFKELINKLQIKKKELIDEVKEVQQSKKDKLNNQLIELQKYCKDITNGKKQYQEYIEDVNMDINKRKNKILNMIDNILNDSNVMLVMVTQPKIAFNVDNKAVQKFLDSLVIDDCDQPFPPVVFIVKIQHDRITIEWKMDDKFQTNNTKTINAFEIEYAKLPKEYLLKETKSSKKSKKQLKKEKSIRF